MRKHRFIEIDISRQETYSEFLRRLREVHGDDVGITTLMAEAKFQAAWRDLGDAQTVDDLKAIIFMLLNREV